MLTVSASVLAVVAQKRNRLLLAFKRKRSVIGWAFFFATRFCVAESLASSQCEAPSQGAVRAKLAYVIDGDTLKLDSGKKLRLVAVNTPELAREGRPEEPLALIAKNTVKAFFADDRQMLLYYGNQKKDRYGRLLAHVYSVDGRNLSAELLAKGLAAHIVVPPNERFSTCYQQRELTARRQGIGVWQSIYQTIDAARLTANDAGFRVVSGRVSKVTAYSGGWWLEMGRLAVSIKRSDWQNFPAFKPQRLLGEQLTLKVWIVDRRDSPAVKQKGYLPFMAHWRHPAMKVLK